MPEPAVAGTQVRSIPWRCSYVGLLNAICIQSRDEPELAGTRLEDGGRGSSSGAHRLRSAGMPLLRRGGTCEVRVGVSISIAISTSGSMFGTSAVRCGSHSRT